MVRKSSLLSPGVNVTYGEFHDLPGKVQRFVADKAALTTPHNIHICDGSEEESRMLINELVECGTLTKLDKYENCYLARTNPADVARVESRTIICTDIKNETIPTPREGVKGTLGQWASVEDMDKKLKTLFDGCMKGRTMYVIPFSMGPVGSPLSKIGIQLTDSAYVVCCMRVMTRMGQNVLETLGNDNFVKCLHSVGQPLPCEPDPYNWPCNPEKTIITHFPKRKEIVSFGSGYGGNSLLGKKCFALRIASTIARDEGWLAEHMLILGLTSPAGEKRYIAAAFPSACGKTNLALMTPTIPGWKVECVGDDIAWMKFDDEGRLRAINPEAGFFGVAPGTSHKTNANAMEAVLKDTIFTNVAETSDGGFFWEGLEKEMDLSKVSVKSWLSEENWTPGQTKAAHPNSRFCAPTRNCPIMDPNWEDPAGVPIDAIIFGGRRPEGVPLVYESLDWNHGVFIGAAVCSETTAAAEYKGKAVMHDPFAMRPFFGYNAGHYMQHWIDLANKPGVKLPKIFHANWFRKDSNGKFLWPGFGENCRVLEWIVRLVNGEDVAEKSAIGYLPKPGALNLEGLGKLDMEELMSIPKDFWLAECKEIRKYFDEQLNKDLPNEIADQLRNLEARVNEM